jgi:hypothetical protein
VEVACRHREVVNSISGSGEIAMRLVTVRAMFAGIARDSRQRMTTIGALLATFVLAGASIGQTAPPTAKGDGPQGAEAADDDSPSYWMSSYYKAPQPDRFVAEVRKMSKEGNLTNANTEPPIVAFLSRVIAYNPQRIPAWMTALADLPNNDKDTLHKAIWYSNTKAGNAYLKEHGVAKYVDKPAPNILTVEIDDASVLDMLWGYFLATGDQAPIRRIVSAASPAKHTAAPDSQKKPPKTDDEEQACQVIRYTAAWSLNSNCREHPRVKEICEKLLKGKDLNPTEMKFLKTIMATLHADTDAKNDKSAGHWLENSKAAVQNDWMKSEHGFGATLVFTDKPQRLLDNWAKPTPGVETPEAKTAPREKPCGIFIMFAGCGADKEGMADVVADLKVFAPDGKLYGEEKDVEIWQKKPAPSRKQIELGVGYMGIVIETKDPAGEYKVRATVRDRVKGVTVELKRTFSVQK